MFFGAGKQGLFDTQNDPYFNNVLLLCHFDGANNSTTITDSSLYQRSITRVNALISTSQSVFGGASLALNGSNTYLETGNGVAVPGYYTGTNTDFNWGTEDFTYECWIRPVSLSGNQVFLCRWYNSIYTGTNAGGQWRTLTQGSPLGNNGTGWTYADGTQSPGINSGSGVLTTNTWYHWAFVRYGNVWKIYINGNSVGTPITNNRGILATTSLSSTTGVPLTIGRNQESAVWYFNGFMDELRVTRGVARYTGNFTPPTQPFPNS